MTAVLYAAFFLSGLAGLVYESIWSRYLGLFVGHGAYAQAIVLVVFLGGLSLGSLLVGQRSERVRSPLLWYAGVEGAVGLYGFFFHELYLTVTGLARDGLFPALAGSPALPAVKWMLAGGLILPPAILLGTTFPLMSAGVIRLAPERPGRTLSLLYFTNSLGAAAGAVVAGFFLLAYAGLPGTILAAAGLNLSAALAVWVVCRRAAAPEGSVPAPYAPREAEPGAVPGGTDERLWRLLLAVSFGTALASFVYQIAWIRMLSLVLGSATHSFELMLSAFILGLALGSFWMRERADSFDDPVRVLGEIQWAMGLLALATLPVYVLSFYGMGDLLSTLQRSVPGYRVFNVARYGFALMVMLPATFCAGATLPLITRTLLETRRGERAIGWVYGVNTLGSIVGVAAASLLLLPLLGLKYLLIAGAALDMLLGVVLLARFGLAPARVPRAAKLAAAGTAAAVLVLGVAVPLDRALLNSGVYRYGQVRQGGQILFYEDGRTATVAVERSSDGAVLTLSTNGKGDASVSERWIRWARSLRDRPPDGELPAPPAGSVQPLSVDEPTQSLLALVTMAHAPEARTAAVVGQGSGITSHFLLGSPRVEEAVTVEIEPAMVEGSRRFYPGNARVFDDPRSTIVIDDAKSYFASTQRSFDVVISEPSNPWVSGVSSLFTVEFYRTVLQHLRPGGVFGQWIQLYEIDDGLVLTILAALHQVFPSYQIFQVHSSDLLVVASGEPSFPDPDWSVFEFPEVSADLALTHPFSPPILEATRSLDRAALSPLLEGWGHPNSDFYPLVDLGAERTRYLDRRADGFLAAGDPGFHPADLFLGARRDPSPYADVPVPQMPRMRALARTSRLRSLLGSGLAPSPGAGTGARGLDGDLYRVARLERVLAPPGPPASWEAWTEDALEVAGILHAGLEGAVHVELFDRLEAYMETRDAPEGPRAAVELVRGVQAREWPSAAGAARVLAEKLEEGAAWVPPELLLDMGVCALVASGDPEGARRHLDAVEPRVRRPSGDLRSRLLRAYVEAADRGTLPPIP